MPPCGLAATLTAPTPPRSWGGRKRGPRPVCESVFPSSPDDDSGRGAMRRRRSERPGQGGGSGRGGPPPLALRRSLSDLRHGRLPAGRLARPRAVLGGLAHVPVSAGPPDVAPVG